MNIFLKKIVPLLVFIAICATTVIFALPTIDRNIEDPNLVSYFDHDEGFLMGLAWYYYSGEKGVNFQYESDYGIELRYISDFARIVLSKIMNFCHCIGYFKIGISLTIYPTPPAF